MKRLYHVGICVLVLSALAGCSTTQSTDAAPIAGEVRTSEPAEDTTEAEGTLVATDVSSEDQANPAMPPAGMPLTVRLDDAVDITAEALANEGLAPTATDGCSTVYSTDMTFRDARTEIERQFLAAGYTINPGAVDEQGLYKFMVTAPASAGPLTKNLAVNIKQERDDLGIQMYGKKVRVMMICF